MVAGFTLLYVYSRCRESAEDGTGLSRRAVRRGEGRRGEERREGGERGKMGEERVSQRGSWKRAGEGRRVAVVVVRPCGSMKSKATLSPELPPFGNDVFRLPGARGINPICLPPSSRV